MSLSVTMVALTSLSVIISMGRKPFPSGEQYVPMSHTISPVGWALQFLQEIESMQLLKSAFFHLFLLTLSCAAKAAQHKNVGKWEMGEAEYCDPGKRELE